jgi:hypothetical protein
MARLAHHVFFTLRDRGPQSRAALVAACERYLDDHQGLLDFSVGVHVPDLDRPVNQDFDVSLHCIFQDRAAHDAYQTAPRHLQFIAENKESWESVRVFDSDLRD